MALQLRSAMLWFLLVLLPAFVTCIRPFRVPKTLFVQGTSPNTLPDGARVIESEEELEASSKSWTAETRSRVRRNGAVASKTPVSFQSDLQVYGKLYMYWVNGIINDNYIFLLAKSTSGDKSTVLLSTDHGKNWTAINGRFIFPNGTQALIDQVYTSKVDPTMCIFADKVNRYLFIASELMKLKFKATVVTFEPSYITFHPWNQNYIMAFDSPAQMLYWSRDNGRSFQLVSDLVRSFHWGVKGLDDPKTIFVEKLRVKGGSIADVLQFDDGSKTKVLIDNVEEFELMKNYLFVTKPKTNSSSPKMLVSYNRTLPFKEAQFPLNEENRDFFVYDISEGFVFVVINHRKNSSNMYLAEEGGTKYQLSLERVLYHNPFTDVSSPWLRSVIPYAFVDVEKVQGMRGTYIATQLTPGPVGKRHLLSLITYNRGGKWQKIPSPAYDNKGVRINCYLPSCSLHLNLQYGAVYRVSPSQRLLSTSAAPGLVLALGVASTNLKIYPDLFMSLDGAVAWKRVLRGKHLFAIGDHGGIVVAVSYRRPTVALKYSLNGGFTWQQYVFAKTPILAQDLATQIGEKLPLFLIYGNTAARVSSKPWIVFSFNLTSVLGPVCDSFGYTTWTDGCLLGRQQQFETRNWTISCRTGRDYKRPRTVKNCQCGRDDFECDFGFQRKSFDEECTLISGKDLNKELVPDNCPEGTFYNRTQGFRKIPGDTCVNGTQADFLPKLTPCPVKELVNLTLKSTGLNKDGDVAIETGDSITFNASLAKGYYPNIMFKWYYGDGHTDQGSGTKSAIRTHQYPSPGKFVVSVVATNLRSTLVEKVDIHIQDKLDINAVRINFNPKNPGVNDEVTFFAQLDQLYKRVGAVKYGWTFEGKDSPSQQPVVTYRFPKSAIYKVDVSISNLVSTVKKTVEVQVTKDLIPKNVTARVVSPTTVLVSWKKSVEADNYIKQYKVFKSKLSNSGFSLACSVDHPRLSCNASNLIPATTYYFKVMATAQSGDGPFSDIVIATTSTSTPGAPNNLTVYAISSTAIRVEWSEPTSPNGKITGYKIKYWSNSQPNIATVDNGLSKSREFTGLQQDTFYYFEVFATTQNGYGIAAGPRHAQTKLSKPSLPPRNIVKVSDNGTCAVLTWDPPFLSSSDNRSFPVQYYQVRIEDKPDTKTSTRHAVICNLSPSTKYDVFLSAYSVVGGGPEAKISIFTQATKPGAPTQVAAVALSANDIQLSWKPPSQSVTGYLVYKVEPATGSKPLSVGSSETHVVVRNLKAFTLYRFYILAKNRRGLGARSSTVKVTTKQARPGKVEFVSAEVVEPLSASIKLTWTKPSMPNGIITEYKIEWGNVLPDDVSKLLQTRTVPGTTTSYTFKHLSSQSFYAFAVTAMSSAGEGQARSKPVKERTSPALKGTERLGLSYVGPVIDTNNRDMDFVPNFIKAVSDKAKVLEDRIADVQVLVKDSVVEFDLIPPLENSESGVSVEKAKSSLLEGFDVTKEWSVAPRSLRSVHVYDGKESGGSSPAVLPSVAQRQQQSSSGSSNKTVIGIVIPFSLIVLVLFGGLIFYFMKYKSIEKNYRRANSSYPHEEDEMKVVYQEPMQADSPDSIFGDESKRGKKVYKDAEKVPLGEHDELAMI